MPSCWCSISAESNSATDWRSTSKSPQHPIVSPTWFRRTLRSPRPRWTVSFGFDRDHGTLSCHRLQWLVPDYGHGLRESRPTVLEKRRFNGASRPVRRERGRWVSTMTLSSFTAPDPNHSANANISLTLARFPILQPNLGYAIMGTVKLSDSYYLFPRCSTNSPAIRPFPITTSNIPPERLAPASSICSRRAVRSTPAAGDPRHGPAGQLRDPNDNSGQEAPLTTGSRH